MTAPPEGFFPVPTTSLPFWRRHLHNAFAGKRTEITYQPLSRDPQTSHPQTAKPARGEYFVVAGASLLDTSPPTVVLTSTAQDKTFLSLYAGCGVRFDVRELAVYRPETHDIVTLTVV